MPIINKDRIILAVIGFFAGVGGQTTAYLANPPRPDPFTMTQAIEMERLHKERTDSLQKQIDELPPELLKAQINRIEQILYSHIGQGSDHESR